MSDLPELRRIVLGVPGGIGGRQEPGGGIQQAFRRGRPPSRPVLSSVTGGPGEAEVVGEGEGEGAGGGAGEVEVAVEGDDGVVVEVEVEGEDLDQIAGEVDGSGVHARPPAGRVRSPRVLTEVAACARAMRARSPPSSVSRW